MQLRNGFNRIHVILTLRERLRTVSLSISRFIMQSTQTRYNYPWWQHVLVGIVLPGSQIWMIITTPWCSNNWGWANLACSLACQTSKPRDNFSCSEKPAIVRHLKQLYHRGIMEMSHVEKIVATRHQLSSSPFLI